VLDANPATVERVPGVRDVARGEDSGDASLDALVDDDAVGNLDTGRLGQRRPRGDPIPATTKSQSIVFPSAVRTRSTAPSPSNASSAVSERTSTPRSRCVSAAMASRQARSHDRE
jgi:hypothetical protein